MGVTFLVASDSLQNPKPSVVEAETAPKNPKPSVVEAEAPPSISKPKERSISFDLSQPLGISFDAKLGAKGVQDGSQAARAGICTGWRAFSVGATPVETTTELVAKVKALKSEGVEHVNVVFVVEEVEDVAHSAKRD